MGSNEACSTSLTAVPMVSVEEFIPVCYDWCVNLGAPAALVAGAVVATTTATQQQEQPWVEPVPSSIFNDNASFMHDRSTSEDLDSDDDRQWNESSASQSENETVGKHGNKKVKRTIGDSWLERVWNVRLTLSVEFCIGEEVDNVVTAFTDWWLFMWEPSVGAKFWLCGNVHWNQQG